MGQTIFQVDSFTDTPFHGNPAGVCVVRDEKKITDEKWMLKVANEMNCSETSFLFQESKGFRLRWFTPQHEVDLCGHATLAAAHILWQEGILPEKEDAVFQTNSGKLIARKNKRGVELEFPALPARTLSKPEWPAGLTEAVGSRPKVAVGRSKFDLLVELENEAAVRDFAPNSPAIARLDCRGLILTAQATSRPYDFVSRFFAPALGIPEDPVTGSAHCVLGPYWAERLGKPELAAYQASERGGSLHVRVQADRVFISGNAVTVLRCELLG